MVILILLSTPVPSPPSVDGGYNDDDNTPDVDRQHPMCAGDDDDDVRIMMTNVTDPHAISSRESRYVL